MRCTIRPATPADIAAVAADLRAQSLAEATALSVHDARDPDVREKLAADLIARHDLAIAHLALCDRDGRPVALLGAWPMMVPGLAWVQLSATPRWGEIALSAHRRISRSLLPNVLGAAVRAAHALVDEANPVARQWLTALGFVENAPALPLGKGGERFVPCFWVNPREPDLDQPV